MGEVKDLMGKTETDDGIRYVILDETNLLDIMEYEKTLDNHEICMKSSNEDIRKCINSESSVGVLHEGELVAYSLCYKNEYGISYIEKCFVSDKYRGGGLQEQMINYNLLLLKEDYSFVVYSMVSPYNLASTKNFKKCGFSFIKSIKVGGLSRNILVNESLRR